MGTPASSIQPKNNSSEVEKLYRENKSSEVDQKTKDDLFKACMNGKWPEVEKLYGENKSTHELKLTKSEDTALHLAISAYNYPDGDHSLLDSHISCIQKMVETIPKGNRLSIFKQKNTKGNTPLHLAAELGSVPIIQLLFEAIKGDANSKEDELNKETNLSGETRLFKATKEYELIKETNLPGETPLFVTVYRGKLQAFLYLHKFCEGLTEDDRIKLCRRGDGDNILHAAISGECFDLAFQIIPYYGQLVNRYNSEGMSPLHYLSRMPHVFKSGRHFRAIASIMYYCINIEDLKLKEYKDEQGEVLDFKLNHIRNNLPENYHALVEFLELLCWCFLKSLVFLGIRLNHENKSPGSQNDPESQTQADGKRNGKLFPANYTTFINFLKCLMKIVLVVLGIGLRSIQKLEEMKKKHTWAAQIMNEMIEKDQSYKFYINTGEKPEDMGLHKEIRPPDRPPQTDQTQTTTSSTDENKTDGSKPETSKTTKVTPLLVASKMGIVEMVEKILKKFPIAIQDEDSDEKNMLLLAVEHRQTMVYSWLIGQKYPEHMFFKVDKQGNNAAHLAAMFQGHELWRIPGAALQLQGERRWYKYVRNTLPPQSFVRYNKKNQTPREIFRETHAELLKNGTKWLVTTANSFSVVAALIATVAFATAAQVPGGADEAGRPHLEGQPAFQVFSVTSLVSLCFSVTALVFFLAILTSRCQHNEFERDLPQKLLLGLTSLFASITTILISFCAAHFFLLEEKFKNAAYPIYAATCIPVVFFAFNQFPLYVDLIRSYMQKLPLRSYKVFSTDSSDGASSKKKKDN